MGEPMSPLGPSATSRGNQLKSAYEGRAVVLCIHQHDRVLTLSRHGANYLDLITLAAVGAVSGIAMTSSVNATEATPPAVRNAALYPR